MVLSVSGYPADAESVNFPSVSSQGRGWMLGPAARRRSPQAVYYRGTRFRFRTITGNRRVPYNTTPDEGVYLIYQTLGRAFLVILLGGLPSVFEPVQCGVKSMFLHFFWK